MELEAESRRLEERLEKVVGIRTVERWAYPAREVRVELDPAWLAQLRIPAGRVLR